MSLLTDLESFFHKHPIIGSQRGSIFLLFIISILGIVSFIYPTYQLYDFLVSGFTLLAFLFERPNLKKSKETRIADLQKKIDKIRNE